MGFGFKQPFVGEKRCVTTLITAAKETSQTLERSKFFLQLASDVINTHSQNIIFCQIDFMKFRNLNIYVSSAANMFFLEKGTFGEITNMVVLVFPACQNG